MFKILKGEVNQWPLLLADTQYVSRYDCREMQRTSLFFALCPVCVLDCSPADQRSALSSVQRHQLPQTPRRAHLAVHGKGSMNLASHSILQVLTVHLDLCFRRSIALSLKLLFLFQYLQFPSFFSHTCERSNSHNKPFTPIIFTITLPL